MFTQLNVKNVLFQTIQFSISTQGPINESNRTKLLGATTLVKSGPGRNGNEGVLCVPQSSRITETSPSDLVSYAGVGGFLSLCREAVYSTAPADWAI